MTFHIYNQTLTDSQAGTLENINYILGIPSVLCSLFIIITCKAAADLKRNQAFTYIANFSIGNLLLIGANLAVMFPTGSTTGCKIAGAVRGVGSLQGFLWLTSLCWSLKKLCCDNAILDSKSLKRAYVLCTFFPIIIYVLMIPFDVYGDTGSYYCWVRPDIGDAQYVIIEYLTFYLYVPIGFGLCIYSIIVIFKKLKALQSLPEENKAYRQLLRFPVYLLICLAGSSFDKVYYDVFGGTPFGLAVLHVSSQQAMGILTMILYMMNQSVRRALNDWFHGRERKSNQPYDLSFSDFLGPNQEKNAKSQNLMGDD